LLPLLIAALLAALCSAPASARPVASLLGTPAHEMDWLMTYDAVVKDGALRWRDVRNLYEIPSKADSTRSVAVVNEAYDPLLRQRLAYWRKKVGMPAMKSDQLRVLGPDGVHAPSGGDVAQLDDIAEQDMDIEAIWSVCPSCKVTAFNWPSGTERDLVSVLKSIVRLGIPWTSMSFGGPESSADVRDSAVFATPGTFWAAASGDNGYLDGPSWPAMAPHVLAVGGTSISTVAPGLSWNAGLWVGEDDYEVDGTENDGGSGSGCSTLEPAVPENTAGASFCGSMRASADISALADPATGLAVYIGDGTSDQGWIHGGGTSLSAPLVTAMYALNGNTDAFSVYANAKAAPALFTDIRTGSTVGCDEAPDPRMCTARTGWDGPSGIGTPVSYLAFAPSVAKGATAGFGSFVDIAGGPTLADPRVGAVSKLHYGAISAGANGVRVTISKITAVWKIAGAVVRTTTAQVPSLTMKPEWRGKKLSVTITLTFSDGSTTTRDSPSYVVS